MSQTTKRRSIRFGKEGSATSIRTGSKSTSDLRQLSLNSFLKTHDTLSMPATASSRRVTDHLSSTKKLAAPKTTPTSPTPDHSQLLKGVVACLDIRFVSCATLSLPGSFYSANTVSWPFIRTEDGDDVSENFEIALQSMGAKASTLLHHYYASHADIVTYLHRHVVPFQVSGFHRNVISCN